MNFNSTILRLFVSAGFLTILFSCKTIKNEDVYFLVNSAYCHDCELIVNGQNLGRLTGGNLDDFKSEDQLVNSNLLRLNLNVGTHDIIVTNKHGSINHLAWTLKANGSWRSKQLEVSYEYEESFAQITTIKDIEDATLIEFAN